MTLGLRRLCFCRPLKITIEDCRLFVDREGRDGVYIAVQRILSGFTLRLNPPR
jgi:hypothetical protein